jgi:hypothetical protein
MTGAGKPTTVLDSENVMRDPPVGAAALNVIVPVELTPPNTVVGLIEKEVI